MNAAFCPFFTEFLETVTKASCATGVAVGVGVGVGVADGAGVGVATTPVGENVVKCE